MPGAIDGATLAACICDRWPSIDIIVVSDKPFPATAAPPERGVFFPKPYRQSKIIAAMLGMVALPIV